MFNRVIAIVALVASFSLQAKDDVLSLDRLVPENFDVFFPNEANIQPDISSFEILNFALLSNDEGERWALVTLKNLAQGRRTLSQKHLMALTADGQRIKPIEFSQSFKAEQTLSLTLNFGSNQFPLLKVYSRSDS